MSTRVDSTMTDDQLPVGADALLKLAMAARDVLWTCAQLRIARLCHKHDRLSWLLDQLLDEAEELGTMASDMVRGAERNADRDGATAYLVRR